jgi:hypothetical protein
MSSSSIATAPAAVLLEPQSFSEAIVPAVSVASLPKLLPSTTSFTSESVLFIETDRGETGIDYDVIVTAELLGSLLAPNVLAQMADAAFQQIPVDCLLTTRSPLTELSNTLMVHLEPAHEILVAGDLEFSTQVGTYARLMRSNSWGPSAFVISAFYHLVISPQFAECDLVAADATPCRVSILLNHVNDEGIRTFESAFKQALAQKLSLANGESLLPLRASAEISFGLGMLDDLPLDNENREAPQGPSISSQPVLVPAVSTPQEQARIAELEQRLRLQGKIK